MEVGTAWKQGSLNSGQTAITRYQYR